MGAGLECFPSKGLHRLNFELCGRGESCLVAPSEQGQVSDCVDHDIQTIAAGPSHQCLIMDILNDVMGAGLECFPSKGLHGLNFELTGRGESCLAA
eukprot:scaffold14313_cov50-Cyclotella_meneghiniana.AAC.1